MKQNKVIDMGLIITETLAGVMQKNIAKAGTVKDLEASFSEYEDAIGLDAKIFVKRYAMKFLSNCAFIKKWDDGWVLVPDKLKAHKLAKEILEESGSFMLESKIRSQVAKRLGQKVSETKLYLDIDDDFSLAEGLSQEDQIGRGAIWGLCEWVLINNLAKTLIESRGPMKEKRIISTLIENDLVTQEKQPVFCPQIDKRFIAESGNSWDVGKAKKKPLQTPKTGALEIKIREEITSKVERLLENQASDKSFSKQEITTALIGSAKSSKGSHYQDMLDEILSIFEKSKKITKVRFELKNPYWIKSESLPKIDVKKLDLIFPLPYSENQLLGDDIFNENLFANLSDPALYWLDGDFSEQGFPEVEPLFILTFNDFVNDELNYISQPLVNAIQASLLASNEWGEFILQTPDNQELSILINFKHQIISGMASWVNGYAQPGDVYNFEYLGSSTFRLVKSKEIKNPSLDDDELERLLSLQAESKLTLKKLVIEVLKHHPGGLTFSGIFNRLMFIRRISRRSLMSELTKFFCFDCKDDKWKYYEKRSDLGEKFSASSFPIVGLNTNCWILREEMQPEAGDSLNMVYGKAAHNDLFCIVNSKNQLTSVFRLAVKGKKCTIQDITSCEPMPLDNFDIPKAGLNQIENSVFCDINEELEREVLDSEVYAGIKQAFTTFDPNPSVNQEVTRSLEELEGLLEDSGSVSPFGGLAWQLQQKFTWQEFQKVLDSKIYSQEHEDRLDAGKFSTWMAKRPIAWDSESIVYPAGHGELLTCILEALISIMQNADYTIEEDSLNIRTALNSDFVFNWNKLLSDQRRIKKIVDMEDSFELVEFLSGWFRRVAKIIEPRKLESVINRLSFHLKGIGSVDISDKDLPEYLKSEKSSQTSLSLSGEKQEKSATLFADFRGFSKAKIKKTLSLAPSVLVDGGLLVVVSFENQKVNFKDGKLEDQISMGSIVAKSYIV